MRHACHLRRLQFTCFTSTTVQILTEAARAGCTDQEHEQFGFDDLDGRLAAERTLDARLAELEALASSEAQHASFARKPEDLPRRRPDTGASKAGTKAVVCTSKASKLAELEALASSEAQHVHASVARMPDDLTC